MDNIQSANSLDMKGFKNQIINGQFNINNRFPAYGTVGLSADTYSYATDRWCVNTIGKPASLQKSVQTSFISTNNPDINVMGDCGQSGYGILSYLQNRTATQQVSLYQYIEDVTRFIDQTISVQFLARNWWNGSSQHPVKSLPCQVKLSYTIPSLPTVEVFAKVLDLPVITGSDVAMFKAIKIEGIKLPKLLDVYTKAQLDTIAAQSIEKSLTSLKLTITPAYMIGTPTFADNVGLSLDIGNIQLEYGPECTPFEKRPLSIEDILCMRYYESDYVGSNRNPGYAFNNNPYGLLGSSEGSLMTVHLPAGTFMEPGAAFYVVKEFKVNKRIVPAMQIFNSMGTMNKATLSSPSDNIPSLNMAGTSVGVKKAYVAFNNFTTSAVTRWIGCYVTVDADFSPTI